MDGGNGHLAPGFRQYADDGSLQGTIAQPSRIRLNRGKPRRLAGCDRQVEHDPKP
jgi:hypothetical protein